MRSSNLELNRPDYLSRGLKGAVAGFLATLPMTALIGILLSLLPRRERYPMPPWQITRKILLEAAEETGAEGQVGNREITAATAVTHFGYGALSGAVYGLTASRWPTHPAWKGLLSGLALWSLSYIGWIPAFRLGPQFNERPLGRNLMMIAANLAWGLVTALLVERSMSKEGN